MVTHWIRISRGFGFQFWLVVCGFGIASIAVAQYVSDKPTEGLTTYKVPSPTGAWVAAKIYKPEPSFKFEIEVRDSVSGRRLAGMPTLTGVLPDGRAGFDATVLNWIENDRLQVLSLPGHDLIVTPVTAGDVKIDGGTYNRTEFMTTPVPKRESTRVVGSYKSVKSVDGNFNSCALVLQAHYPTQQSIVGLALQAYGPNLRTYPDMTGSFTVAFFASVEPEALFHTLTLTQATINGAFVDGNDVEFLFGPVQDFDRHGWVGGRAHDYLPSTHDLRIVRYLDLPRANIVRVFQRMVAHQLIVAYNFGDMSQVAYLYFDASLDAQAVQDFTRCEADTRVFESPVGVLLNQTPSSEVP